MNRKSNYISDFRHKEVIDITSGSKMGFITDVDVDLEKGVVNSVILPGKRRFFGFFPSEDVVIPWKSIQKIGDDVILVVTESE
ncbi:MAG: YlmC/YmxH family sporulation protein [Clostridia bacterium]